MAQLSISSGLAYCSKAQSISGQLRITTDSAIPDPAPADFKIEMTVYDAIPDTDFSIDGFVWTTVTPGEEYSGYKIIPYTTLAPTSPLTLAVTPLANSQIDDNANAIFELTNPSGLYTVNPASDQVAFTIYGNPTGLILMPSILQASNSTKLKNQTWFHATLYNASGGDLIITDFDIPDDSGSGLFTYFVDDGAGGWNSFISGASAITLSTATALKVLVKLDATNGLDYSTYHLYVGYKDTAATPTLYESAWGFSGDTTVGTYAACASSCLDVAIQSMTWFDGSTKSALGSCPGATDLGQVSSGNFSEAYVDVDLLITNNCSHSCPNQSNGYLRLGDLESGWYSFLTSDDGGNIAIQTAVPTIDSGFVMASGATKTITIRITADTTTGTHRLGASIASLTCLGAANITSTSRTNQDINVVNGIGKLTAAAAGTDFNPIPTAVNIQGSSARYTNQTINYSYAAKWVGSKSAANYLFTAGEAKTHYFTVHYSLSDASGASERDISYYVNGAQTGVITENLNAHSGVSEFSVVMGIGDTFGLGAFTDVGENISESITVAVSMQDPASTPDICEACDIDLYWDVVDTDMDTYPTSPTATQTVGEQTTLTITLTNNSSTAETVTGITIDPAIATDLSIYFPSEVTINPGSSYDFDFRFLPTSVYSSLSGSVTFTTSITGSIEKTVTLSGVESVTDCQITPTQNEYNIEVDLGVSKAFTNTLVFSTYENYGTLIISRTTSNILFPTPNNQYINTEYRINVNPSTSVVIPFAAVVPSPCPSPTLVSAPLNWYLYDDKNDVICSGTVGINIDVNCPDAVTECPVFFAQSSVIEDSLAPSDTGSIVIDINLNRAASLTGDQTYSFTLPSGEAILSWNATQQAAAGLTWDTSGIAGDPRTLGLTVASTYTGTSFEIKLDYTIPADQVTGDHESLVTATSSFVNTSYSCGSLTSAVTLSIYSDVTAGGFAAALTVSDNVLCSTVNLVDASNYGADGNHDAADFDAYREIVISLPSGTDYVLSSISADNGELIDTPADSVFTYTGSIEEGGIYQIYLYVAPTWTTGLYNEDDCVVVMDGSTPSFYKSLQDSNNREPAVSADWEDYWELLDGRDDLTAGYIDTQYYKQLCEITQAKLDLQEKLFCAGNSQCTDYDTCFKWYEIIRMYERLITEAVNYGWYDKAELLYADALNIANKTSTC